MTSWKAYAKCLIAGEHAVVRGYPALVTALPQYSLELNHRPHASFELSTQGDHGELLRLLFWGALDVALEICEQPRRHLSGHITLENTLPIGRGLGFSAALSWVIARWFAHQGWVAEHDTLRFAQRIEDAFHGTSSGVDVVGVSSLALNRYQRGHAPQIIHSRWQPHLCVIPTQHASVTCDAIEQVDQLRQRSPALGHRLDMTMADAVQQAQRAFSLPESQGRPMLQQALTQARDCFEQWGLITAEMRITMDELHEQGALTVKPTGAGGGGYLLVLAADERLAQQTRAHCLFTHQTGVSKE